MRAYITVPEENDVLLGITILKKEYKIRFTYNDTGDCWSFGLYEALGEPIVQGIKIVPNYPMNILCDRTDMPKVVFVCESNNDHVGRYDFRDGKASFYYLSDE